MNAKTKTSAYLIWETTKYDNTLALWRCAESIGDCFASMGLCSPFELEKIMRSGFHSDEYVSVVRKIAYMLYVYTNDCPLANWYNAEKLLSNAEWRIAAAGLALERRYGR